MNLLLQAYPLARRALFTLDAETAHDLTLRQLSRAHRLGLTRCLGPTPLAPVRVMNLDFRNQVGLAAGLDKNGACIDAFAALGFGFVEVGTVTPRAQAGNPKPRVFRLPEAEAMINRLGFNNEGLDSFIRNVKASEFRRKGGVLGLNIGKNADTPMERAVEDYLIGLRAVYAHADYITINISSPNTQNLRELQGKDELSLLLSELMDESRRLADANGRKVALLVKIAPDLDDAQVDVIADTVTRLGIDGVIATNTTLARDAVQHLRHGNETGGLSGRPVHQKSLAVIQRLRARAGNDLAIIGVGGILDGQDARAKLDAGADLVQLYTGLIYRGPSLIRECVRALQS